jgi:nitrite reductase/ring-hydroxylating ferredoxin subunit
MVFKEVTRLAGIPEGTMKQIEIGKLEILLVNFEEKIYALSNRCGHMDAPLSDGSLEGKIIECSLHSAQFDVTTGKNIRPSDMGEPTFDLKTYEVKMEKDIIKIEI